LATDDPEEHKNNFHLERGIPVFNSRLDEIEREQTAAAERDKKYKEQQLLFNSRMAWFTGLLVVCTAIGGGISAWQAYIANRSARAAESAARTAGDTLKEIQKGGTDTHTLAQAASDQVTKLKEQVDQLKRSADETHNLVSQSRQAVATTESTATKDRRPYLSVVDASSLPRVIENTEAAWNFQYTNYGRSPAVRVLLRAQIVFGRFSDRKIDKELFERIHPPGFPEAGFILAPGQVGFSTAFSKETLSAADVDEINKHDSGIVLLVHFEYFDMSGNEYSTEICQSRLVNGIISHCNVHNVIK
jgi:hypothetical protein